MKIQIATDYAIRILQYLHAVQAKGEGLQTAMTISRATGLTYPIFIKLANQLKVHGLLNAVQGRNGGYVLGKQAGAISIYDVFRAVEGEMQISRCFGADGTPCTRGAKGSCGLRQFFCGMQADMIEQMRAQNIRDLEVDFRLSADAEQLPPLEHADEPADDTERQYRIHTADKRTHRIPFDEIVVVQSGTRVNTLEIHTEDGTFHTRGQISKVAEIAPEFFSAHRSYTVNVNHVRNIDRTRRKIELSGGRVVPIANYKVKALTKCLAVCK